MGLSGGLHHGDRRHEPSEDVGLAGRSLRRLRRRGHLASVSESARNSSMIGPSSGAAKELQWL